jgi:Zn-finger protein
VCVQIVPILPNPFFIYICSKKQNKQKTKIKNKKIWSCYYCLSRAEEARLNKITVVLFVVLAQIKDTFVKNVIILAVAPEKNKQKK